ncbi:MAG: sugar ABC transporter permease [Defluviitaleaceae bacterium]|nr:sugar ABC transporter permease [Defluviitaleaceae bacterium]
MTGERKGLTMRKKQAIAGYLFILPFLIGLVGFFLLNMVQAVIYSFNDVRIVPEVGGLVMDGVGLENFQFVLFQHGTFNRELIESLIDMVWYVPLIIFFSLFMAMILNRHFIGRSFVRMIFFVPVIMATPAILTALELSMSMMMGGRTNVPPDVMAEMAGFSPEAITFILGDFGLPDDLVGFIVDSIFRLNEILRMSGVQILIFLAALQAIPAEMYEVAQIEGATGYETFWKITFPMVSPLILTNVVYTIVDLYSHSPVVETATSFFFEMQQFGISSAMSIVSGLVACMFLLLVGWIVSKYVFYVNG